MSTRRTALHSIWLLVLIAGAPAAHAQWAVVDVGAIAQLVQQVQVLEQELATARGELSESEQTFRSMTGDRGMGLLLAGAVRNYLPTRAGDLRSLLGGNPGAWGNGGMGALLTLAPMRRGTLSLLPGRLALAGHY